MSLFNEAFMRYCQTNDIYRAKLLINLNLADPNYTDFDGKSALYYAIINGNADLVQFLIKNGANVNVNAPLNNYGTTPLMLASIKNLTEIVDVLIKSNAQLDATDKIGQTALIKASYEGHINVVNQLIRNGAMLDILDNGKSTALIWASFRSHVDVVKLLIETGANVDCVDDFNYTAIEWAIGLCRLDIVSILANAYAKFNVDTITDTTIKQYLMNKLNGPTGLVNELLINIWKYNYPMINKIAPILNTM